MSRFPVSRGSLGGNMWNKPFSGARSRKPRGSQGPSGRREVFQKMVKMRKLKGK